MKATLEFNLPDEQEEYSMAIDGGKYRAAVDEVYSWIRSQLKYNDLLTEPQSEILESLRTHLSEYINIDTF